MQWNKNGANPTAVPAKDHFACQKRWIFFLILINDIMIVVTPASQACKTDVWKQWISRMAVSSYTTLRVSEIARMMQPMPAFSVSFSCSFRHRSHVILSPVASPRYKYFMRMSKYSGFKVASNASPSFDAINTRCTRIQLADLQRSSLVLEGASWSAVSNASVYCGLQTDSRVSWWLRRSKAWCQFQ